MRLTRKQTRKRFLFQILLLLLKHARLLHIGSLEEVVHPTTTTPGAYLGSVRPSWVSLFHTSLRLERERDATKKGVQGVFGFPMSHEETCSAKKYTSVSLYGMEWMGIERV